MRKKVKKTYKDVQPDDVYGSVRVSKLINYMMKSGKKSKPEGIVYGAFEIIKEKTKKADPVEVFEEALRNTGPLVEVRSRRVGGANYQVPVEVRPERKLALSMRWIIEASRGRKGAPIKDKLAEELILASKNEGSAVKKRENVHKMAEANKAFAHFAW